MIKAVIFDFDGVIGDTMEDNFRAWQTSLSFYCIQISPLEYYLLEGMGRYQIAQYFIEKYGLNPGIERDLVSRKEKYYKENNTFKIFPEILPIFNLLERNKICMALVTGASISRLYTSLKPELASKFSSIVTSDDVVNCKPDPEPYNMAVKKLNLNSDECLVIENARLGIKSAKLAGCKCFAIETTLTREYLSEADATFDSHLSLFEELQRILDTLSLN